MNIKLIEEKVIVKQEAALLLLESKIKKLVLEF
jgi:hypothetical protein